MILKETDRYLVVFPEDSEYKSNKGPSQDEIDVFARHCIKEGVTEIFDREFEEMGDFGEAEVPGWVKKIGKRAYADAHMGVVILHEGVEDIGEEAFDVPWLKELYLPSTIKHVGVRGVAVEPDSFMLCEIEIKDLDSWHAINWDLTKEGNRLDSRFSLTEGGFSISPLEVPKKWPSIKPGEFANCELDEIIIHSGITEIGRHAFAGQNGSVTMLCDLPVEQIFDAFEGSELETFTVTASVKDALEKANKEPFWDNLDCVK